MNHPGCPGYKVLHTFALKGSHEPGPGSLLDSHWLRGNQWTGRRTRRAGRCLPFVQAGSRHESSQVARQGLALGNGDMHLNRADAHGNATYLGPDPYFDDLFVQAADKVPE